ncbi:unnamed protein product [Brassicogethes aeneus]|uniref:Uncharacterized protein n=1 Tax=Brassicogethes aeneus TaxID=1431903 RepID=A0A9P0B4H0_BRAAE|nr:unnamed protein product [Brassicogethes aeneus]
MKNFKIRGVFDKFPNFSNSTAQPSRPQQEIQETLRADNFQVKRMDNSVEQKIGPFKTEQNKIACARSMRNNVLTCKKNVPPDLLRHNID